MRPAMVGAMRFLRSLQRIDQRAYDLVTRTGVPVLDPCAPKFVQATDNMAPWWLMSGTLAVTGGPRLRRTALRAILAAGAANAASYAIKQLVRRPRPESAGVPAKRFPYRSYRSSSFPSGHTAAAVAFAAGIGADAPVPLTGLVSALAGTVAFSRVHSGVHYPGDVLGGIAVGIGTALVARAAIPPRPELVFGARTAPAGTAAADPEGRGVTVVLNPRSADSAVPTPSIADTTTRVARHLPKARIIPTAADDDLAAVMDGAARESDVLAVAGGDGTVNAGAAAALEHGRPLLVLPDGTLNNFARSLGLTSVETALRAYDDRCLGLVDVGEADGNVFLNTASFGSYPRVVARRDRWAGRIGKWPAFALALGKDLQAASPLPVVVDGQRSQVWWAFVGNCRYRTHARVPGLREALDDGWLDVRILVARTPFPRLRAAADVLLGRFERNQGYTERLARSLTLVLPGESRLLSVDGEVLKGSSTVVYRKRPRALRVFVPSQGWRAATDGGGRREGAEGRPPVER